MKTINFKHNFSDGDVSVMSVDDLNVVEIRYHRKSRNISIVCDQFTEEDLEDMSYQAIKKLVIENGGKWENKKEGIEFLTNL